MTAAPPTAAATDAAQLYRGSSRTTRPALPPPNQTVSASLSAQIVAGWASNFAPGAADEAAQTPLGYSIASNTQPSLFSVVPAIDASGRLTYTPAGAGGTATIGVRVRDSGGTANGGVDTPVAHDHQRRWLFQIHLASHAGPSSPGLRGLYVAALPASQP